MERSFCSSLAAISVTTGLPIVSVPVLSNTIVSILLAVSSASPLFIKIPNCAAFPVPTMMAVGVARPSAHGQAITSTLTKIVSAKAKSCVERYQSSTATKAIAITVGTKYREILSAIRAIGAFLPCASSTIRMIFASVVSSSTALHSITILASSAIVPWINASPCCLETGILSPVSMLSSTLACPSFKIPSTGICSPGFTTSRSPIVISSA